MNVDSAASIVAWHYGIERENAIAVTELDASESSIVRSVRVVGVTVATSTNTTVDASGVAVPSLESDVANRLAGSGVNELDVEGQRDTRLVIGDVLANKLARDP